jgi:hypothetical protein
MGRGLVDGAAKTTPRRIAVVRRLGQPAPNRAAGQRGGARGCDPSRANAMARDRDGQTSASTRGCRL